jgi:hypothetical protein
MSGAGPGAAGTAAEAKRKVIAREKSNPNARHGRVTATARAASWGNKFSPVRRTVLRSFRLLPSGCLAVELPIGLTIGNTTGTFCDGAAV